MNTIDLLEQLSHAVHRDAAHRRHRHRLVLLAAALTTLLVGGVAVAGTTDGWWGEVASENASVGIDLDLSTKAVVARAGDSTLEAVATNGGKGYCLSMLVHGTKALDTSCTTVADSEYRTSGDASHWFGYGRILDAGAAGLDMSGAGLPAHVQLERGGFYAFQIPSSEWQSLDGRTGNISILDANGKTIRETCVFVGNPPPSPMSGDGDLGDKPGTCAALKPIVSDPELDKAKRAVTLTLTHDQGIYLAGDTLGLWTAPNRGGGVCWWLSDAATAVHTTGYSCGSSPTPPATPGVSATLVGDHYANLVAGFVDASAGAVRAELVGADETLPAAYANGAVIGELPDATRAGKEPGPIPGAPWRVVLYDASGTQVDEVRLAAR